MGPKCGGELWRRQRRGLVKHAQCLNKPSIEEDPAGLGRVGVILLDVATQSLLRECNRLRTRAPAA